MGTKLFGIVLMLVGLVAAFITGFSTWQFVRSAQPVTGKIETLSAVYGESKNYIGKVSYQFESKPYQAEFRFKPRRYAVGQAVALLVNPRQPEQARVNEASRLWTWPFISLVFASIGLIPLFRPT